MPNEQKSSYLEVTYNYLDKPKTDYPYLLMQYLLNDLLGLKKGTLVDIGCGRGDQLEASHKLGFSVIGLDKEKKSCSDKLEYKQCDFIKNVFPLEDNTADVVFLKSVIEHIYYFEMDHLFSEMKRICKPNGYILISTPDWKYNAKEFYEDFTHCTPFTQRSMNHCLQIYGLSQVMIHSLIPLPSTWNSSAMKLVSNLINILSPPRTWGKWCNWSQSRQIIAYGNVIK